MRPKFVVPYRVTVVFMAALTIGFLGLRARTCAMSALMTEGLYDYDDVVLRIESGASKHFRSNVNMFTSWNPEVMTVTFNTAAGTTITSRVVGTVNFKHFTDVNQRVVNVSYHVPHQPPNLVAVGQLIRNFQAQWESPDSKNFVCKTIRVPSLSLNVISKCICE